MLCLFITLLFLVYAQNENEITINTALGSITGTIDNNYVVFKGISYTENPPIEQYRFTESIIRTTPYNNSYNATQFKSICIQRVFFELYEPQPMSEDCLYLNIWTSNINPINGSIINDPLPVLFWIHGGGFNGGSASDTMFDGKPFMESQNVIYVSINYRLGSLGFIALNSILTETNGRTTGGLNGVNDIITALQWVNQNIADYGGNPNKITAFGESAGGIALCMIIASPVASNLLHQVAIQSGQCIGSVFSPSLQEGLAISQMILNTFNLTDNLNLLRDLPASMFKNISVPPSVDNYILTHTLDDIYMHNAENLDLIINVDTLIIGFNSMDSGLSFPFYPYMVPTLKRPGNNNQLRQYLNAYIENTTQVDLLLEYYPIIDFPGYSFKGEDIPEYELLWATMNGDVCQICGSLLQIELMIENTDVDIYLYNFLGVEPFYVPHGAELSFLFNQSKDATDFWGVQWNQNLAYFFTEMWTNYAMYGVPNSSVDTDEWVLYEQNGIAMSIQDENGVVIEDYYVQGYRNGVCEFWVNDVGMDIAYNLCHETIQVSLDDESDDKMETWMIVLIVISGIVFLVLVLMMYRKCCSKKSQSVYTSVGDNELPKYGSAK